MTTSTTTGKAAAASKAKASPLRDSRAFRVTDKRSALIYMADDDQLAAMARGDFIPRSERAWKEAPTGAIVTDLPAMSTAKLLAAGWIELVKDGEA